MNRLQSIMAAATLGGLLAGSWPAGAAITVTDFSNGGSGPLYTGSGSGSQVIPDYPGAGAAYSINFAATGLSISDISITLNLSGGYNGDIYAYLSHGSQIAYLLNANSAVSGSGMNLTFVEGTGNPIPTGGSGTLTGSYTAYSDLAAFNTTDPNGNWTLFFADRSSGDASTLNSFSIGITAVPEPVNVALALFGGMVVVWGAGRRIKTRQARQTAPITKA